MKNSRVWFQNSCTATHSCKQAKMMSSMRIGDDIAMSQQHVIRNNDGKKSRLSCLLIKFLDGNCICYLVCRLVRKNFAFNVIATINTFDVISCLVIVVLILYFLSSAPPWHMMFLLLLGTTCRWRVLSLTIQDSTKSFVATFECLTKASRCWMPLPNTNFCSRGGKRVPLMLPANLHLLSHS